MPLARGTVFLALLERLHGLSHEFPRPLTDDIVQAADVVTTMGRGDACPVYPGKRYLDWNIDDPAGKTLEQIRPISDEIDRRVRDLLTELTADPRPSGTVREIVCER